MRASGLLVSELGYGVQPRREAFPVRNRIIAGLAELVVVVEATLKGGARITAERALEYGRTVMAYPGSRRNPSAAGTNALLYDGATVVLEPVRRAGRARARAAGDRSSTSARRPPATPPRCSRPATASRPRSTSSRAGPRLAPSAVVAAVRELERDGWMERARGLCWPR